TGSVFSGTSGLQRPLPGACGPQWSGKYQNVWEWPGREPQWRKQCLGVFRTRSWSYFEGIDLKFTKIIQWERYLFMIPLTCLMDFLVQSNRFSRISSSDRGQSTSEVLNFWARSCRIMAAETETFRLSEKPSIGIFNRPSARCNTSSLRPSFSVPKNTAVLCFGKKSCKGMESLCGVAAT